MGLAAATGASATPLSVGLTNGTAAAPNASLIEDVAYRCRRILICHRGRYGRRICHRGPVCRPHW